MSLLLILVVPQLEGHYGARYSGCCQLCLFLRHSRILLHMLCSTVLCGIGQQVPRRSISVLAARIAVAVRIPKCDQPDVLLMVAPPQVSCARIICPPTCFLLCWVLPLVPINVMPHESLVQVSPSPEHCCVGSVFFVFHQEFYNYLQLVWIEGVDIVGTYANVLPAYGGSYLSLELLYICC